jgi:hypothetical protein
LTGEAAPLDLARPRTFGPLFSDSLRIYFENFARCLAIGAAVVIPTELIVSGVGLGQLSSGYDPDPPLAGQVVAAVVQGLVTTPLIVAMTVYLLLDLNAGKRQGARAAMQSGLDAFAPMFVPVLLSLAGIGALIVAALLPGLLTGTTALAPLLILPLMLAVRWFFIAQSVVVEGVRGRAALAASWNLTRGFGWRVFAVVAVGYFGFFLVAGILTTPLASAARSADSGALLLASRIVIGTLASPAVAVLSALLYFDLKARR